MNRNINNLLYTISVSLLISCSAISTENPCDPSSNTFLNTQLLKFLLNDTSSTCGVKVAGNSCGIFENGEAATIVLGQVDFTDNSSFGTAPNQFRSTFGLQLDFQGGLWVSDSYGSPTDARIMHFPPPLETNASADIILAVTPMVARHIAMDLSGGIWVVSGTTSTGNKILHFAAGMNSSSTFDIMLGTGSSNPRAINTMSNPFGVAVGPDDKVWVADYFNNRVLRFSPPFTTSMDADLVIGADDFTTAGGGAASSTRINSPTAVAVDKSGNLWVSEFANNRILRFSPPFTNGMQANMVLGQPNFTSSAGGTSQFALMGPNGISIQSNGAVWVADSNNGRAVRFSPPFTMGKGADRVLGKPNFTAGSNTTPTTTNTGSVVSVAAAPCGLWVTDSSNRRVLFFP
ncbi:NHL repeat-containing protein [Leptospira sarikeiensis]|uniref:NHL repeat-containing protein n=1 Tax=Leptospira sarikeiensis TaxID=2484943 RepID=UPI001FEC5474|nr:NHL repeat-containing protein [Leptospira sarikeiensis]